MDSNSHWLDIKQLLQRGTLPEDKGHDSQWDTARTKGCRYPGNPENPHRGLWVGSQSRRTVRTEGGNIGQAYIAQLAHRFQCRRGQGSLVGRAEVQV